MPAALRATAIPAAATGASHPALGAPSDAATTSDVRWRR